MSLVKLYFYQTARTSRLLSLGSNESEKRKLRVHCFCFQAKYCYKLPEMHLLKPLYPIFIGERWNEKENFEERKVRFCFVSPSTLSLTSHYN